MSRAQEQTASGQGWGGATERGHRLVRLQRTSASLPPAPRPPLPRALCRAAGNRAGQGAQNQESQEDKRTLVGVLESGGGLRPGAGPGRLQRWGKEAWLPRTGTEPLGTPPTLLSACLPPPWLSKTLWPKEPALMPICIMLQTCRRPPKWGRGEHVGLYTLQRCPCPPGVSRLTGRWGSSRPPTVPPARKDKRHLYLVPGQERCGGNHGSVLSTPRPCSGLSSFIPFRPQLGGRCWCALPSSRRGG